MKTIDLQNVCFIVNLSKLEYSCLKLKYYSNNTFFWRMVLEMSGKCALLYSKQYDHYSCLQVICSFSESMFVVRFMAGPSRIFFWDRSDNVELIN